MKQTPQQLYRKIVFNCFKYIYQNESQLKEVILSDLKDFAKIYRVVIRKTKKLPTKLVFSEFLDINIGFNVSINKLYWSIA